MLRYDTDARLGAARGTLNPYAIPAQQFSNLNAGLTTPSLATGFLAGFLQSAAVRENRRIAESQAEDAAIARGIQQANLEAQQVRIEAANRAIAEDNRRLELEEVDAEIRREAAERLRERIFNGRPQDRDGDGIFETPAETRAQAFENEYYDIAINHQNPRAAELLEGSLERLDAQGELTSERRELIQDRRNANLRSNFLFGEDGTGVDANGNPLPRSTPASTVLQAPDSTPSTPATRGLQGQTTPATETPASINRDNRRRNPDGTLRTSASVTTQANEALRALNGTVAPTRNPVRLVDNQVNVLNRLVTQQAPIFQTQDTQSRLGANLQQLLSALGQISNNEVSV